LTTPILRPWSTESHERRWAMAIATVCVVILISLPFWPEKTHDLKATSHAKKSLLKIPVPALKETIISPKKIAVKPVETTITQVRNKNLSPPTLPHISAIKNTHANIPSTSKQAYFIQVGAFNDQAHAKKLQQKLTHKHWAVIIHKKKHLFTVQVGPYSDKLKASNIKKKLHRNEKINGFISLHAYP